MADQTKISPAATELPPEVVAFAGKMYNAARAGQIEIFQQALPAGLPANMTNEKGDTLVRPVFFFFTANPFCSTPVLFCSCFFTIRFGFEV